MKSVLGLNTVEFKGSSHIQYSEIISKGHLQIETTPGQSVDSFHVSQYSTATGMKSSAMYEGLMESNSQRVQCFSSTEPATLWAI